MGFAIKEIQVGQRSEARADFSNANTQDVLRRGDGEALGLNALL